MKKTFQIVIYILVFSFSLVPFSHADITSSQVLVLYNSDWKEDHPLTEKGQDSREIAEHYVKVNTDVTTGEKPYILGLSGKQGKRLNSEHLEENSNDNKSGVILTSLTRMIGSTYRLRDSRLVEFKLPKNEVGWQFDTLKIQIGQLKSKLTDRLTIIENGKNLFPGKILLQQTDEFNVRFNGQDFLSGSLLVNASCRDKSGENFRWKSDFKDMGDISLSSTGPDNIRDDKNYLDLIETPVKSFLEDPKNALKDGTLLKDHILFFVISYGLPRTCIAPFGIERGISASINNFGAMIDLGQRMQLMDYDVDSVLGTIPRPYRFDTKEAFTAFYLRAPQSFPLYGRKANPFLHPELYKKDKKLEALVDSLSFTTANRKAYPKRHLYFAMRIDAADSVQAKSLLDRAAYARKYAAPHMGVYPGKEVLQNESATGKLKYNKSGTALWDLGYKRIYYRYTSSNRLELFRLPGQTEFYNKEPVYLPGGIAATVISSSGWNRNTAAIYDYMNKGVTITLGAARVYEGAPHIHNKSWWDDDILYKAFTQGKTIGEALLINQTHLGWIASFIGDPLYRLPVKKIRMTPPDLKIEEIQMISLPSRPKEIALAIRLKTDLFHPQMAQMKIKNKASMEYICSTFERRPYVILKKEDVKSKEPWQLSLIDPFGRETQTSFTFEQLNKDRIKP
jgi:hypothetical protein